MDEENMIYGGFSMAKVMLSNALPSSLYYPDPPLTASMDGDAPSDKEDGEEEKDSE